jgi:alkylation response protein AidB-like acyl-CoA dehydrogenase
MDLDVPSADRAAVDEACAWLEGWLPADYDRRFGDYRLDLPFRSSYQRAAFDEGWLVPAWERHLGGRGLGPEAELWIKLSFAQRRAPKLPNVAGPGVIAPALLAFGSPQQQSAVAPLVRGDQWWCLGMSEPDAGSDLASLRTSAQATDDTFVINGQKVWTSTAREASTCLLFARTNPDAPRHRGISALIVPMAAAGITIRPIEKIGAGDEDFCEVYFDDIEVPRDALLGPLDGGWGVAMASLEHERDMIWIMNLVEIERALELAGALDGGDADRSGVERARLRARADAIRLTGLRGLANRLEGRPDRQVPLLKLASTEAAQEAFRHLASVAGEDSILEGEIVTGEIEALGATIYGGTSEIHRNLLAERLLDLPR